MIPVLCAAITGILISSGERELEIPELVVTGRYEATRPLRTLWPLPDVRAEYVIEDYDSAMPAYSSSGGYDRFHTAVHRPLSHVSCSIAGGPESGYLITNISEPRGGLSFTAWSEPGERLDRRGIRGSIFSQGEWGMIMASGDRWEDRLDDDEIASGWAAGEVSVTVPWGKMQSLSLGAFSTSGEGDDIHFQGGYSRAIEPVGIRLSLNGSDRQAEGTLSWRTSDHRLCLDGGASWLNLDDYEETWFVGSANISVISNSSLSLLFAAERRLGISTRKYLRTQFPLAASTQTALPRAVEWDISLESAFSIAPHIRVSVRGGAEKYSYGTAWREAADSTHWVAEPYSGSGGYGTIQTNWSPSHALDLTARMTAKSYRFEETLESLSNDVWPLIPKLEWFIGLSALGRLNARLGLYGIFGMNTFEGNDVDDAVSFRWDLGYRLRRGLRLWSSGSVGTGWEFSPIPNRTVTIGLAWSLFNFSDEE